MTFIAPSDNPFRDEIRNGARVKALMVFDATGMKMLARELGELGADTRSRFDLMTAILASWSPATTQEVIERIERLIEA